MEKINLYLFFGIFLSTILATFLFTKVETKNFTHIPILILYPITMPIGFPAVFMPMIFTAYISDHYGTIFIIPSLILCLSGYFIARFIMKKFIFT